MSYPCLPWHPPLVHTYARRSVSYCPPAYYADKAAFRGRALIAALAGSGDDTTSISSGGSGGRTAFAGVHPNIQNTLFYM